MTRARRTHRLTTTPRQTGRRMIAQRDCRGRRIQSTCRLSRVRPPGTLNTRSKRMRTRGGATPEPPQHWHAGGTEGREPAGSALPLRAAEPDQGGRFMMELRSRNRTPLALSRQRLVGKKSANVGRYGHVPMFVPRECPSESLSLLSARVLCAHPLWTRARCCPIVSQLVHTVLRV